MLSHIKPYTFLPIKTPPLLFATISLMLGIWWQATHLTLVIPILFATFALYAAWLKKNLRNTSLILGTFFLGTGLYYYQQKQHALFFATTSQEKCSIQGKVLSITQIDHPLFSTIMTIELSHIKILGATKWQRHNGIVQIYNATRYLPEVDDVVCIDDICFKKPTNEEFNTYLCKEGVNATLFMSRVAFTIIHRPIWSLRRCFFNWRLSIVAQLQRKMSQQTFTLFSALFLGNKQIEKEEFNQQRDQFLAWGISHQLARSGLHLILVVALWELLLIFMMSTVRTVLVIGICSIYFLLSWPSIGFLRALCMLLAYKFCLFVREPISSTHILTLICFAMLITNPLQLFFLNFQLNFALTFALSWFNQLRTQQKRPFM